MREGKKHLGTEWIPNNFTCTKTWAKNLRFRLAPRKEKFLPARLKPFASWLQKQLDEDGNVSNANAKAKYTELFGAPKSQKTWSKFSSAMRKRYGLNSEKVKDVAGKWQYWWAKNDE